MEPCLRGYTLDRNAISSSKLDTPPTLPTNETKNARAWGIVRISFYRVGFSSQSAGVQRPVYKIREGLLRVRVPSGRNYSGMKNVDYR